MSSTIIQRSVQNGILRLTKFDNGGVVTTHYDRTSRRWITRLLDARNQPIGTPMTTKSKTIASDNHEHFESLLRKYDDLADIEGEPMQMQLPLS